jgi:3',5'-cyclic-AMP phosphodiesterase
VSTTVLQLSDIHLPSDPNRRVSGRDPDGGLRTVLDAWRRTGRSADLVVLSGDIADDGSAAAYTRVREAVAPLGAPVLALPGNHDEPRLVADAFGGGRVVDLGAWLVVGLDTFVPEEVHGALDLDAARGLLDSLDGRPTAVVLHHPPASRSTHEWFQLDGAGAFLDGLASRPHVRLLLSGHLHDAFEIALGTATLLGAPSTFLAIAHDGDRMDLGADAPIGARVVTLGDDGAWRSELLVA